MLGPSEESAASDPTRHPWWGYLPKAHQQQLLQRERQRQRLKWFKRRRNQVILALVVYALTSSIPLFLGALPLSLLALLQLFLLPSLAGLAWWLLWREFNR